jgi:hypothetical protein
VPIRAYEAAAILASYAAETYDHQFYSQAAKLALGIGPNAASAVTNALAETQHHPRLTLEDWLSRPDTNNQIAHRVALQEAFVAYRGIARRAASPLMRTLTVAPLHRPHSGFHSRAFEIQATDNKKALLKIPRRAWESPKLRPLQPDELAYFTEQRIRLLPRIPGINFEQIIAASYTGTVVTSYIPGRQVYKLGAEALAQITDAHLLSAVNDLTIMARTEIRQDGNGGNTHFDTARGFGFFDPLTVGEGVGWCLVSNLQDFSRNLGSIDHDAPKRSKTPDCRTLRYDLFQRLKALAPYAPPEAAPIIAELEYKDTQ